MVAVVVVVGLHRDLQIVMYLLFFCRFWRTFIQSQAISPLQRFIQVKRTRNSALAAYDSSTSTSLFETSSSLSV